MAEDKYIIVVGVDFEPDGNLALDHAIELADAHEHSEIHILYVDHDFGPASAPLEAEVAGYSRAVSARSESTLDRLETLITTQVEATRQRKPMWRNPTLTSHFRLGNAAEHIVQLAVDLAADIIVVGTHGRRGVKRLLVGSVAASVLRMARCPVFVVRPKDHEDLGDIPKIEPPCPKCVEARAASKGEAYWCEEHSRYRHPRAHTYQYTAPNSSRPAPWGPAFD